MEQCGSVTVVVEAFILAAEKVRDERRWVRLLRDRLWREDLITRKFDELCGDDVPGDILGLRSLFDMSKFPGPVEDEEWDSIWQCFYEMPSLMAYIMVYCKYYEQSTTPPVRSQTFG
ncbi:hypothetical protein 34 [Diadegma semiclausum ichnovirus]|nr:hypothetical protein 34 [Diadegma semiclausum ichnovirus]